MGPEQSAKRGRRSKPYRCPWDGKVIDGLYRKPDGRWRIVETGAEFREADERRAIARFRRWQQSRAVGALTFVGLDKSQDPADVAETADKVEGGASGLLEVEHETGETEAGWLVDEQRVWEWVRQQIRTRVEYAAAQLGVAPSAFDAVPKESIRLASLWAAYRDHSPAANKRHVKVAWDEFARATSAETLRDLESDALLRYADGVRSQDVSPSYVADKFARVKRVIKFGLKRGMDAAEIRGALDRCAVLVPPERQKEYTPQPISPGEFHALLGKATPLERAALLLALNACMYAAEVVGVRWEEVDLEAGTLLTRRGKTGIVRAAALWDRTVSAIRALPRSPGAIFKSNRGAAYVPNSLRDLFNDLRGRASLPPRVKFNNIRDGAFTAACAGGVEFHLVQILAGHKTLGQADAYIARNPAMVRPACDAVERHYFGGGRGERVRPASAKAAGVSPRRRGAVPRAAGRSRGSAATREGSSAAPS